MCKIKIGMLSFAHGHAKGYFQALIKRNDVEIVGISDDNRGRVSEIVEKHSIMYFKDYHDLLKTDADLIIINSENVRHAEHTIAAAEAGKHVMCEKPLGTKMGEMQEMIEACKKNNVQLMTAFANRYIPTIVETKKVIDEGQLGEIIAVKATNKGTMPTGWFLNNELSGGGAMLDHSVHVADILNWILSSPIEEVYAEKGTLYNLELATDDSGMICMRFKNGVIATLDTSWSRVKSYPNRRDFTMEFIGTKGTLLIDYFKQITEVYSQQLSQAEWSYWGDNKNELLINDLIDRLKSGDKVAITGEDGLASSEISLAAYASVQKQKVIKVKEEIY